MHLKPIQVFHFILDHRFGGPHAYVRLLVKSLSPEVVSTVVTTGRGELTDVALTNLRHLMRLLYPIELAWNVLQLCWIFHFKHNRRHMIFDIHGAANLAPVIAARILGVSVVWHFHEILPSYLSLVKIGKKLLEGVRHRFVVVAQSASAAFDLPEASVLPGAVDINFWHSSQKRISDTANNETFRMVAVANLNPLKGIDILLEALQHLNIPFHLDIVGAPLETHAAYAQQLQEQARKLSGPTQSVEFLGFKTAAEVRHILTEADAFVLPSRSEACPIALLEAMAMECPVVACDVGDVRNILADGRVGEIVPPNSPKELSAALARVASLAPEARRAMGAKGRSVIVDRYSQRNMIMSHLRIYQELLGDKVH